MPPPPHCSQSLISFVKYPPLLNPKNINYDKMCAELAWELNLPLPKNYKFVWIASHGIGFNSTERMFRSIGINTILDEDSYSKQGKYIYVRCFNGLQCNKHNIIAIIEYEINRSIDPNGYHKFLHLLQANVPILCQMRDPIGLLRHMVSRKWVFKQNVEINLTSDYHEVTKYINQYVTSITNLSQRLLEVEGRLLPQNTLVGLVRHSFVHYMDMREINADRAFDTFVRLSNKLNFEIPEQYSRKVFTTNVFKGNLLMIFPVYLYVSELDIDNKYSYKLIHNVKRLSMGGKSYKITIDFPKNTRQLDISKQFCKHLSDSLCVYVEDEDYEQICKNEKLYDAFKEYMLEFIEEIEKEATKVDNSVLKEKDILEYLKCNKDERYKVRDILEPKLVDIKKYRPDIVGSWEYYKEFQMLFELD